LIRFLLLIALLSVSVFGYKDNAYLGLFGSTLSGDADEGGWSVENDGTLQGFRWGLNHNRDIYALGKLRYEVAYSQRDLLFKEGGSQSAQSGNFLSGSIGWGQNLDWLLNHEIVPYIRIGAVLGSFEDFDRGTALSLGVGVAYTMRYFEITTGVDREFWQLNGTKIPYKTFYENDAQLDLFHAGINWRF
jgi:hypothetical protein